MCLLVRCLYLLVLSLSLLKLVSSGGDDVALIRFYPSEKFVCAYYNATWMKRKLPTKPEPLIAIRNTAVANGCDLDHEYTTLWRNQMVVTQSSDCFMKQVHIAQSVGVKTLIVLSRKQISLVYSTNDSAYDDEFPQEAVVFIVNKDDVTGVNLSTSTAAVFSPLFGYDTSDMIMWILAVLLVAVGAYWAQQPRKRELKVQESKRCCNLAFFWPFAIITMVISLLVLLYFFYNIVVWFVIGMFCLGSSCGLYQIISSLFCYCCPCQWRLPVNELPCLRRRPSVASIISGLIAVGISVTWVVVRHNSYSWVLQDILGSAIILSLIREIRIQSFKMLTILLVLFMSYDVFMVFITPFLTSNHKSIMVQVAMGTGRGNNEKLPLVIRMPKINPDVWSTCGNSQHMLGFGDIAIPGLLVSFCLAFDRVVSMSQKHCLSYYISSLCAYGGGLITAFVVTTMTNQPQPALVYLVPATLLMVLVVGWRRSELKQLWHGIEMVLYYNGTCRMEHFYQNNFVTGTGSEFSGVLDAVPVTREDDNPFHREEIMTSDDDEVNYDKTELIRTSTV